jgi:hypothetical protein
MEGGAPLRAVGSQEPEAVTPHTAGSQELALPHKMKLQSEASGRQGYNWLLRTT